MTGYQKMLLFEPNTSKKSSAIRLPGTAAPGGLTPFIPKAIQDNNIDANNFEWVARVKALRKIENRLRWS